MARSVDVDGTPSFRASRVGMYFFEMIITEEPSLSLSLSFVFSSLLFTRSEHCVEERHCLERNTFCWSFSDPEREIEKHERPTTS